MSRILTWIDDRTGVRAFTRAALYEHIPGGARWRYVWGSTLVFAFVVPVVTPTVQRLAVGGTDYGHHTLTRFFALHAGLLPLLMIGLIGLHVYLFRRHGLTVKLPRRGKDSTFWVDQVLKDAVACLAVLATVLFLIVWPKLTGKGHYGAELSAPADPSSPF